MVYAVDLTSFTIESSFTWRTGNGVASIAVCIGDIAARAGETFCAITVVADFIDDAGSSIETRVPVTD